MPDPFTSYAERCQAVLALVAQKGPLTLQQIVAQTGSSRHAVERVLSDRWFERLGTGRGALFGLSAEGKEKVKENGAA